MQMMYKATAKWGWFYARRAFKNITGETTYSENSIGSKKVRKSGVRVFHVFVDVMSYVVSDLHFQFRIGRRSSFNMAQGVVIRFCSCLADHSPRLATRPKVS